MFEKILILIGAIVLTGGILVIFFGGTWESARIGLEILGAIWLLQNSYKVLIKNREEKKKEQETKKLADKYFREN